MTCPTGELSDSTADMACGVHVGALGLRFTLIVTVAVTTLAG